jgi:membrane protease YdiL (CAAX protease family)
VFPQGIKIESNGVDKLFSRIRVGAAPPLGWVLTGFLSTFVLFHLLAEAVGSYRGEAGLAVAVAVLAALCAFEAGKFGSAPAEALRGLGLGRPRTTAMALAVAVSVALAGVLPVYAALRGATLQPYSGWPWLLPGLFAQGGIAEEGLFRGYLFRHIRRGRSFWRAALLSCIPFAAAHLLMFASQPWPVALAAIILSLIISFPLAHLFELGGNSIWPPALLHFTVQGALKVVTVEGDTLLPLIWIAASAAIPYAVFLMPRNAAGLRAYSARKRSGIASRIGKKSK